MNRFNRSIGLGLVTDDYSDQPWLGPTSAPTTTPKASITDVLKNWFGVAKEGVDIYNTYKDGGSTTPNYTTPPPPPPANNTGKLVKYGLITAGVGVLAYAGYQVLKGGKKKK